MVSSQTLLFFVCFETLNENMQIERIASVSSIWHEIETDEKKKRETETNPRNQLKFGIYENNRIVDVIKFQEKSEHRIWDLNKCSCFFYLNWI